MARRAHLYPSRTQKLSAAAATIVRKCDNSALPGRQRTGRSFFFLPVFSSRYGQLVFNKWER